MMIRKFLKMIVFFSVLNLIISEIKEKEITDELENMDSIENKEPNEKSFEYKFRTNSSFDYYIIKAWIPVHSRVQAQKRGRSSKGRLNC